MSNVLDVLFASKIALSLSSSFDSDTYDPLMEVKKFEIFRNESTR
jgi:hypothetical protein